MAQVENSVTLENLLVFSLAQTDALPKCSSRRASSRSRNRKICEERATYQAMFKPTPH